MSKLVYMVHIGKKAMLTYNKKDARKIAKQYNAMIRFMPYQHYKSCHLWDYPTFYQLSEPMN